MPYLLEVSGSVSSSVDISIVSSGSVVLSYDVPGRVDERHDEWHQIYNETGSLGLNSIVESGSFSTSTVVSTSEISSSYFNLELENSKTIEIPHKHCHLYYYKASDNKWLWVGNNSGADLSINDYLFGSDGNPVKITGITHYYDVVKSFNIVDVEEIDNAFYVDSSDNYGILKHNKNNGNGGGGGTNDPPSNVSARPASGLNAQTKVFVDFDAANTEDSSAKYDVRYSTSFLMTNATLLDGVVTPDGSSDYSYCVQQLDEGTTYWFQVRQGAGTTNGASNWTSGGTDSQLTSPANPGAPTTTNATFEDISISWTAVQSATSYTVYWVEGTGNPTGNATTPSPSSATSITISGALDEATNYSFRVKATNATGTSDFGGKLTQSTIFEDEGDISLSNNLIINF